jgi:acyl-CoA reductase-like NAD-dependent aldehyde dehydrogenase
MVRAAYSSGKPTIAVGAGNVPAYVGASVADPAEAAEMILTSKSFDNGTACVAEQSVVVVDAVADAFLAAFAARGAHWLDAGQQEALARTLFDERGAMRPASVGQSAGTLARLSGFSVPRDTRVLAARLDRVAADVPLSKEILGPVLSVYRVSDAAAGLDRCRQVLALGGEGHTAAVHAADPGDRAVRRAAGRPDPDQHPGPVRRHGVLGRGRPVVPTGHGHLERVDLLGQRDPPAPDQHQAHRARGPAVAHRLRPGGAVTWRSPS